jgi:hypothetical protein
MHLRLEPRLRAEARSHGSYNRSLKPKFKYATEEIYIKKEKKIKNQGTCFIKVVKNTDKKNCTKV